MTEPQPHDPRSDAILPPDWAELSPLLDQVLDAPPAERGRVLDAVSNGDRARRAALEKLVAECGVATPTLDTPAAEAFADLSAASATEPMLPTLLGDRYRTGRVLGEGGMARVFLAHDVKHGRDVAVKVIRAEVAVSLGRERFLREIAIAARLRHPNIVPLFDSGDANGVLYFVMPFEAGPSLSARLSADGPLPIAQALSVLRDVARALQYAHDQGVVHRDIKPDNVMMSGGAAVVADFGIAKAVSAAQTGTTGSAITQTGAGIGTPAYMAPEQAVGDPATDQRADIYSFGCLAYAVLTGKPPFTGMSTHQIIAAHVTTVAPNVSVARPDVPPVVAQLVARSLEKDPALRPQTAASLVEVLDGVMSGNTTGATIAPTRTAGSRPARALVALGVLTALVASGAWFARTRAEAAPEPLSMSVLPITNISSDTSISAFADGLGDEIFTALRRVPGVEMRSRNGARNYRGKLGVDTKEVGHALNVDYVVTGTMREINGKLKISVELTRAADGTELWSQTFDRTPTQQIGVAEEIATAAAAHMRERFPRVLGVATQLAQNKQTRDPEAYRLYVLGQELLRRRGRSVKGSADAFRQAIRLDSNYAGAYAGLSVALALYPYFQGSPVAQVAPEIEAAARRALAVDPTLSQPHVALGMLYAESYEWELSEREFHEALRLPDVDAEAYVQYGRLQLTLGRNDAAAEQFEAARRIDPASPLVLGYVAYGYATRGQLDSARLISQRARQTGQLNFSSNAASAVILLRSGFRDSALALAKSAAPLGWQQIYVVAAAGDTATVSASLRALDAARPQPATANVLRAWAYLGLGDTAKVLDALERSTDAREPWPMASPLSDPVFDAIRNSQRLHAVMRRVGLPESAADRVRRTARR